MPVSSGNSKVDYSDPLVECGDILDWTTQLTGIAAADNGSLIVGVNSPWIDTGTTIRYPARKAIMQSHAKINYQQLAGFRQEMLEHLVRDTEERLFLEIANNLKQYIHFDKIADVTGNIDIVATFDPNQLKDEY